MVFFDLDDTLIDSNKAYAQAYAAIGIDPHSTPFCHARDEAKSCMGKNHTSSHNRWAYVKRLLETQAKFSARELIRQLEIYESALTQVIAQQWVFLQRAEVLKRVKKNCRLAIITNETLRTQILKLNEMDPDSQLFELMVTSEEAGVEKSSAKIFQIALTRMNTSAKNSLMIGNDELADLKEAKLLGMNTELVQEFTGGRTLEEALAARGLLE